MRVKEGCSRVTHPVALRVAFREGGCTNSAVTRPLPVAARLRQARIRKRLTQTELAKRVNVSRREIGRWEAEGVTPHPKHAAPLAVHLGLDPEALREQIEAERFDKKYPRADELEEEGAVA